MKTINFLFFSISLFFIVTQGMGQTQIGSNLSGIAEYSRLGWAVDINFDGTIAAVGAPHNPGVGRIFQLKNNDWIQLGNDIVGQTGTDGAGSDICLNSTGNIVAIALPGSVEDSEHNGRVQVYRFENNQWVQMGNNIDGRFAPDNFAYSIDINAAGNILIIGAINYTGVNGQTGAAYVYRYKNGIWSQLGNTIIGENDGDATGADVAINAQGNIIVVGASANDNNGENSGAICVYRYEQNQWVLVGDAIYGDGNDDLSGHEVSINGDGSIIAIGAVENDIAGPTYGQVRVFENMDGNWTQQGNDIYGVSAGEYFGYSISLDAAGQTLAIGARFSWHHAFMDGFVGIYRFRNGDWEKAFDFIYGQNDGDQAGASAAISGDASAVIIGSPHNEDNGVESGHARVFSTGIRIKAVPFPLFISILLFGFAGSLTLYRQKKRRKNRAQ